MAWGQYRLFHLLCAALFLTGVSAAQTADLLSGESGDWALIKNLNDPHLQELGEFAVAELNKQANLHSRETLRYNRIVNGQNGVGSDSTTYVFILSVDKCECSLAAENYGVLVSENDHRPKILDSFRLSDG